MAFKYSNVQHKHHGPNKQTRKVHIVGSKGYKCVAHFRRGKKTHYTRKQLTKTEINMIQKGQFVKGLFNDCQPTKK